MAAWKRATDAKGAKGVKTSWRCTQVLQQVLPDSACGLQRGAPAGVVDCFYMDSYIRRRNKRCSLFWPFCELEAGGCEDVAKAGVFPLARVAEAVKIEVPHRQTRQFVRLDHGVGRAFDTPLHAQCAQQMAHQRGLACAEFAMQRDEDAGVGRQRLQLRRKLLREGGGVVLGAPEAGEGAAVRCSACCAFYNPVGMGCDSQLVPRIQAWGRELGFSQIGVAGVDLSASESGLVQWLAQGFHGTMDYMAAHGLKRARPAELVPGTVSVITARMDYLPRAEAGGLSVQGNEGKDGAEGDQDWRTVEWARLARPQEGVVSLYARGRDYHKVLRARLQKLCDRIAAAVGPFGHRVFTDSAPVLEAALAERSGLGWRGKHTLVIDRAAGSMFFLGEIYTDLALEPTQPVPEHCGSCSACLSACPTGAIVAPYRLDARRCISYLTIEHPGAIPIELRPLLGNRIYGCDDCQLVCPWNKFARRSNLPDFDARAGLRGQRLVLLFAWDEATFLRRTEGSPIRRIGHERWLRNIAVALGNALRSRTDALQGEEQAAMRAALQARSGHASSLVREHVVWALAQGG